VYYYTQLFTEITNGDQRITKILILDDERRHFIIFDEIFILLEHLKNNNIQS